MVVRMRYLRHAPTAFWFAVLLVFVCVCIVGLLATAKGTSPSESIAAPAAAPKADIDLLVTELSGIYPAMNAGQAGTWAANYDAMVHEGFESWKASGGRPELADEWRDTVDAADELQKTDPQDAKKYVANAGTLGAAVGRLATAYRPPAS